MVRPVVPVIGLAARIGLVLDFAGTVITVALALVLAHPVSRSRTHTSLRPPVS